MVSKEVLYKFRFIVLILSLIAIDLFSKNLAVINLMYGQTEPTIFPFIDFLLIYNSGCFLLDPTDEHLCQHLTHFVFSEDLTLILKLFPSFTLASEEINKK